MLHLVFARGKREASFSLMGSRRLGREDGSGLMAENECSG